MSEFHNALNSGNPELIAALAAVAPDCHDIAAALVACRKELTARQALLDAVPAGHGQLVQALGDTLRAGGTLPADFGEQATAAVQRRANLDAERALLLTVANGLESDRDSAFQTAQADVLLHLDGRVKELVGQARALDLHGVSDAEQAIDRGVAAVWAQYVALRASYWQCRDAQVLAASDHTYNQHATAFAMLENFATLHPSWLRERLLDGGHAYAGQNVYGPPWPEDPAELFLWLVRTPAATVWVPTHTQLREAHRAASTTARAEIQDERPYPKSLQPMSERDFERRLSFARTNAEMD